MRILKYLETVNFRHIYATLILFTFILITTLPFWIGSKGLSQHSWTYLVSSQGAIIVLLTLAGRRYFEIKGTQEEVKKEELPIVENTPKICTCNQQMPNIQPLQ